MRITKTFSGFCPVQGCESSIDVEYEVITSFGRTEYLQVGADCEYGSFNPSEDCKACPIRARAPKQIGGA